MFMEGSTRLACTIKGIKWRIAALTGQDLRGH